MFKDLYQASPWAQEIIQDAARFGLMMGNGAGNFDPQGQVTREQLAAVAVRMYRSTNEDFVEIINRLLPAVVKVGNGVSGIGSGTIIHRSGLVLTNAHVVQMADGYATSVTFETPDIQGWSYAEGVVLSVDPTVDLALCQIQLAQELPTMPLCRDFLNLGRGMQVLAIGSPLGLTNSVSQGVVAAIRGKLFTQLQTDVFIQTTALINPGNSGGALVDMDGHLVGVPSMKLSGAGIDGIGLCIGLPVVLRFLEAQAGAGKINWAIFREITEGME